MVSAGASVQGPFSLRLPLAFIRTQLTKSEENRRKQENFERIELIWEEIECTERIQVNQADSRGIQANRANSGGNRVYLAFQKVQRTKQGMPK